MNKKLVKFIEGSDIDSDIKEFIIESLAIEDIRNIRYIEHYEKLIHKHVGDRL